MDIWGEEEDRLMGRVMFSYFLVNPGVTDLSFVIFVHLLHIAMFVNSFPW